jgi:hypothetical protein
MSPRHFVEVRTTPGGPAPVETTRALEESRKQVATDRAWLDRTRGAIERARRAAESPERSPLKIHSTYVRVLVVWGAVLAALYLLQESFS